MNKKEANQVINGELMETSNKDWRNVHYASGYLEAIEKAKVLEETLVFIQKKVEEYAGQPNAGIKEALEKWENNK